MVLCLVQRVNVGSLDYINHPDSRPDLVAKIRSFIENNIEVQ